MEKTGNVCTLLPCSKVEIQHNSPITESTTSVLLTQNPTKPMNI